MRFIYFLNYFLGAVLTCPKKVDSGSENAFVSALV